MTRPSQLRSVFRGGLLAPVTVLFHTARSAAPGTTPPTQLAVLSRAVALLAFTISVAEADSVRARPRHTTPAINSVAVDLVANKKSRLHEPGFFVALVAQIKLVCCEGVPCC